MSAEVEFREHYTRADIRAEPEALFVFGDNMERKGFGGQAREARGEPNAVGIPTKWGPHRNEGAYFTDSDLDRLPGLTITDVFSRLEWHLAKDRKVVWPDKGIGSGLAQLPRRAPAIDDYIAMRRNRLVAIALQSRRSPPSGWEWDKERRLWINGSSRVRLTLEGEWIGSSWRGDTLEQVETRAYQSVEKAIYAIDVVMSGGVQ